MKLLTELTTVAASRATALSCVGLGFEGSALAAFCNVATEDLIELVSLGKSVLAELTSLLASL